MLIFKQIFKILTILGVFFDLAQGNFPNNPRPCRFRDTRCIQDRINYFLNTKYNGDGFINFQKIDPLNVPLLTIQPGSNSSVNIDLIMRNNLIIGLKEAKAISVRGFERDLIKNHEIIFQVPQLHITGDYSIKGKVIVLPVEGSGKHDITLDDVTLVMQFSGTPYIRNGRTYMRIDDLTGSITPKKVISNFDHLFNGDKVLTANVNNFINDNWSEIFPEIHSSLVKGMAPVFQKIYNDIFSKLPYDEFFIKNYYYRILRNRI
ncbi:protein takeout-like [Cochliomyia hominivorax]